MANDINALIKSLLKVQQCREDRETMRVANARVVCGCSEYYCTIILSSEAVLIQPNDINISDSHFRSRHIRGYHEMVGRRGIQLNIYNNLVPRVEIYFRTDRQMARALRRLREITGSESTSGSSLED